MTGDIRSYLASMQEQWEKAHEEAKQGPMSLQLWEDGVYEFQLQEAELYFSSQQKLTMKLELLCHSGYDRDGDVYKKYQSMESEVGRRILVEWFTRMGHTPPNAVTEFPEFLEEVVVPSAPKFKATLKTTKGKKLDADGKPVLFQNMYIDAKDLVTADTDEKVEDDVIYQSGDRVRSEIDGDWYSGTVTSPNQNGMVEVTFDDGDEYTMAVDAVEPLLEKGDQSEEDRDLELLDDMVRVFLPNDFGELYEVADVRQKLQEKLDTGVSVSLDEVEVLTKLGFTVPIDEKPKRKRSTRKKRTKK